MKALGALAALLLLGAAAPPTIGPSFSCKGALSPSEAAICGDPELAAWDRAVARIYRAGIKTTDIDPSDQRQWLSRRDECRADQACLLRVYREWPGFDVAATGIGRVYERTGTGRRDPASLEIMPIHGDWYYFSLIALHQQTDDPASTNTGVYSGVVRLVSGIGTYDEGSEEYSCRFQLERERSGWSISTFGQTPKCGGLNVFVDGNYRPVRRVQR